MSPLFIAIIHLDIYRNVKNSEINNYKCNNM
jgi:hypothetical protein